MSFLRKIIAQTFGTVSEELIESLAQDSSRQPADRGRDIARAIDRSGRAQPYLAYRDGQLWQMEQNFKIVADIHPRVDRLRELSMHHARSVNTMAKEGDETLLENAHKLEGAENELRKQWHEMLMELSSAKNITDKATDVFTALWSAEQHMATLPQSEKTVSAEALKTLNNHAAYVHQLFKSMPPEITHLEKNVANARNNITARENAAREATLAAEANNLKVKFNEYLQTGLATSATIKAPKTARFTRKPKTATAKGVGASKP